eukprot:13972694-Alexandrium_andersonii.AAC.1
MPDLLGVRPIQLRRANPGKTFLDSKAYKPVSRADRSQRGYRLCERAGRRVRRVESQLNVEEGVL